MATETMRRKSFIKGLLAVTCIAVASVVQPVPASAAPPSTTNAVTVKDTYSTLTLKFDTPISLLQASQIKDGIAAEAAAANSSSPIAAASQVDDIMACTTGRSYTDTNGTYSMERICSLNQIRWKYDFSAYIERIAVSPVSERGLDFWINGVPQPRNAQHTVPAGYLIHGTMSNIKTGQLVDYQDYMTFRHNIGPGGTATITFAGRIRTT